MCPFLPSNSTSSDMSTPPDTHASAVPTPFSALHCDLYELTMAQGYWEHSHNLQAVFDMFIRNHPFDGGFTICAGIATVLEMIQNLAFSEEDIVYLRSTHYFKEDFLTYLQKFKFIGTLFAVDEGQIIFPYEPIVRVHATLIEAQIIEGLLLNTINHQSLIATKTARIYLAAEKGNIFEFGMRRAHGIDGALSASRAAYIGGAVATSHVAAGKKYHIPISGTMAHSWIMAFPDEEKAFNVFSTMYKENIFFVLDTYNTLKSGIIAAIKIGQILQKKGIHIGVRLDSGDIQYLSTKVRAALDRAGLRDAKIAVSNDLDENIIRQLVASNAPVDIWGVGTKLITGYPDASLSGVYKLAAKKEKGDFIPVMKFSENPEKSTNPGIKQVYRFYNANNEPQADLVTLVEEQISSNEITTFHHPSMDYRQFKYLGRNSIVPLLTKYLDGGKLCRPLPSLKEIRRFALDTVNQFDSTFLRLINPHVYKVSISSNLKEMKERLITRFIEYLHP